MIDSEKGDEMGQVIQIDEARIKDHLGEMVRGTVEESLNAMQDAEADRLCGAGRYERNDGRKDTRAGGYARSLHAKAGEAKQQGRRSQTEGSQAGTRVSPGTVSNLNKKIYAKNKAWRHRRIEGDHPYLYLDAWS